MNQMRSIYTLAFLISFSCFSQTREHYVVKYKSHIQHNKIISDIRQSSFIEDWHFITQNKTHPLSRILKFSSDKEPQVHWFNSSAIEYFERLPETFLSTDTITSDPYLPFQWENDFMNVKQAWHLLENNDTNFLVGIVDSGTDFDHEDLQNTYINPNEPINGVDDDNNGYIDDYRGWDFGEYDNDPSVTTNSSHGREMTSLVVAETNNSVGIAASSYNVKYITTKFTKDNGQSLDPYEGVMYLVDQGVKVINCSWYQNGNTNYGREVIDYALSKDVLVIASAGNLNSNTPVFPASYPEVIGVGAIDQNGFKTSVSNYGDWVDIYAPGKDVYVAFPNNTYFTTGGTSVSCALVSSASVLLRKLFPEENASQILSRIKRSGTPISDTDISGRYINLKNASQASIVNSFQIFPNPNKTGELFIDIPFVLDQSKVVINIYNTLGQRVYGHSLVMENGEKTVELNLDLDNGQYILSVESENIHKTSKFTLAR